MTDNLESQLVTFQKQHFHTTGRHKSTNLSMITCWLIIFWGVVWGSPKHILFEGREVKLLQINQKNGFFSKIIYSFAAAFFLANQRIEEKKHSIYFPIFSLSFPFLSPFKIPRPRQFTKEFENGTQGLHRVASDINIELHGDCLFLRSLFILCFVSN